MELSAESVAPAPASIIESRQLTGDVATDGVDDAQLGGKGAGLARLLRHGAEVPAFFVVPPEHFLAHLDQPSVRAQLDALLAALEAGETGDALHRQAAALGAAIETAELAAETRDAIAAAFERLGADSVAVRSSMIGEDGTSHSFAGQLRTSLHVRGLDEVSAALRTCWASAFSTTALTYATRAGLSTGSVRMAVVVQRFVSARAAGVMFTADPTDGDRSTVVIAAAWGLGEAVVSGLTSCDEYRWQEGPGEISADLSRQDVMVVPDATGGVAEQPLAGNAPGRVLEPQQVDALARMGVAMAQRFGEPLDIEWAIDPDGALTLLQARPITTLEPAASTLGDDGPFRLWDNANIQESYCGVTTPLTFSFASRAYARVYETTARMLGVPDAQIRASDHILRNMLGLMGGRIYYNLNSWYDGLSMLPGAGRNRADMDRMMGVDSDAEAVAAAAAATAPDQGTLGRSLALARVGVKMAPRLATTDRQVTRFRANLERFMTSVDRTALPDATFSELMALLERIDLELLARWEAPILNDFRVMMSSGSLRRCLAPHARDEEHLELLLSDLLSAIDGLASVEPTRRLLALARIASEDRALAALLRSGPARSALDAAQGRNAAFDAGLADFLAEFGDRCMGELKLETLTLRDDPTFVVEVLRMYLDRPDLDPASLARGEELRFDAAREEARALLEPNATRAFERKLRAARHAVAVREDLRLARTRVFGLVRDIYRAIGARLTEAGRLDAAEDVLHLTVEEILALHEGRAVTTNLRGLVELRRAEVLANEERDMPDRFTTTGPASLATVAEPAPFTDSGEVMVGTGCFAGVVEAEAAVVLSPADAGEVAGRIIVAVRTDPGWAPLFPAAAGLVVERGSTLSHSAVVARELGLPTVVGVSGATTLLRNGELLRVDGAAGTVTRLSP